MKIAYRYPIRWAISFVCCSACYRSLDAIKSNLFKFSGNIFEYFSAIPNNRGNVECGCCLFLLSCKQNIFPSKMPIYHLFSLSIWWTMYLINGIHTQHVSQGRNVRCNWVKIKQFHQKYIFTFISHDFFFLFSHEVQKKEKKVGNPISLRMCTYGDAIAFCIVPMRTIISLAENATNEKVTRK